MEEVKKEEEKEEEEKKAENIDEGIKGVIGSDLRYGNKAQQKRIKRTRKTTSCVRLNL